jgi:hypothetical protein
MREIEFRMKIELKDEYKNANEIERYVNKVGQEIKQELYKRVLELEEEREIKRYKEEGKVLKKRDEGEEAKDRLWEGSDKEEANE